MTTPDLPVPTPEQLSAVHQFVKRLEREAGPAVKKVPEVQNVAASWAAVTYRNLGRAHNALLAGNTEGAARAWAVLLDIVAWWRMDPRLPADVRAQAEARMGQSV